MQIRMRGQITAEVIFGVGEQPEIELPPVKADSDLAGYDKGGPFTVAAVRFTLKPTGPGAWDLTDVSLYGGEGAGLVWWFEDFADQYPLPVAIREALESLRLGSVVLAPSQ